MGVRCASSGARSGFYAMQHVRETASSRSFGRGHQLDTSWQVHPAPAAALLFESDYREWKANQH